MLFTGQAISKCLRQTSRPYAHCWRTRLVNPRINQARSIHKILRDTTRTTWKKSSPIRGKGTICLAALTPMAFVELGEEEIKDGKTGEEHMLEASRAELAAELPRYIKGSHGIRRGIWVFLDTYIIEPIATGFRLLHLMVLFVPVIVTIPAIWIGARQKDRDDERSGTLWWYGFLVNGMERAGAAFIKVSAFGQSSDQSDWDTVGTMGSVKD